MVKPSLTFREIVKIYAAATSVLDSDANKAEPSPAYNPLTFELPDGIIPKTPTK